MNQEPPKKKKVKIEVNKIMNPSDDYKIDTKNYASQQMNGYDTRSCGASKFWS